MYVCIYIYIYIYVDNNNDNDSSNQTTKIRRQALRPAASRTGPPSQKQQVVELEGVTHDKSSSVILREPQDPLSSSAILREPRTIPPFPELRPE